MLKIMPRNFNTRRALVRSRAQALLQGAGTAAPSRPVHHLLHGHPPREEAVRPELGDSTDKRVKYVQLREKGSSICAHFFSDKEEQQRIQNLGLTPEELSQLNMLLGKVLKHLDAIND